MNHKTNIQTIQNLMVMAIADDFYDISEQTYIDSLSIALDITDEEYDHCYQQQKTKRFVIPEKEESAYEQLYHMVMMLLSSDGKFSEIEVSTLYNFGREAGINAELCSSIINKIEDEYFERLHETILFNKTQYDKLLELLRQIEKSDSELIHSFNQISIACSLQEILILCDSPEYTKAMYAWLYLVYYRYTKLSGEGSLVSITILINQLLNSTMTLDDFFNTIKIAEDQTTEIYPFDYDSAAIAFFQNRLNTVYPFNQNQT